MKSQHWDPATAAARTRELLGGAQRGTTGAQENTSGPRRGPPDAVDAKLIARRIVEASLDRGTPVSDDMAKGIAANLVRQAQQALMELEAGKAAGNLHDQALTSLEAVMRVRGRPAVRILDEGLEHPKVYPGGEEWEAIVDPHERNILASCCATAALRVTDRLASTPPWVQGTAWMVGHNIAITNRHVLFPPLNGVGLVRRVPGTRKALMKRDYSISLDFDYRTGTPKPRSSYDVVAVPFITVEADALDIAILQIDANAEAPAALRLSTDDASNLDRLYVVGHPGVVASVSEEVQAVFGTPDGRKRVSFGRRLEIDAPNAQIVHDASTIGGYSGGCVIDFATHQVAALHYWGDPQAGNRAITAAGITADVELSSLLESGRR